MNDVAPRTRDGVRGATDWLRIDATELERVRFVMKGGKVYVRSLP